MKTKFSRFIIAGLYILIFFCTACNNEGVDKRANDFKNNPFNDKDRLENINHYLTEKDKDIIETHIRRQGWKMALSYDGYFYEIYNAGNPNKIKIGDEVEYEYKISLLDGTILYETDEPKNFLVGQSEEISGLHQSVKLLGKGGRAKFIFPPQLAYGLQGDMKKIPPRSIVVYDINILDVK